MSKYWFYSHSFAGVKAQGRKKEKQGKVIITILTATYKLKSILHSINFSNWRSSPRIFEFTRFLGQFVHPLRNLLPNKRKKNSLHCRHKRNHEAMKTRLILLKSLLKEWYFYISLWLKWKSFSFTRLAIHRLIISTEQRALTKQFHSG